MPNWKLPKIETNFTNFEVWSTKIELPKIEITNIEGYQYRGIPVLAQVVFSIFEVEKSTIKIALML